MTDLIERLNEAWTAAHSPARRPIMPALLTEAVQEIERLNRVVETRDVNNTEVVGIVCPTHETVLVDGQCKACGAQSERNRRVAARWDELSAAGKHGHYETLFQIVREEVEPLENANEELIRGMTEMAERFTAAMDKAHLSQQHQN